MTGANGADQGFARTDASDPNDGDIAPDGLCAEIKPHSGNGRRHRCEDAALSLEEPLAHGLTGVGAAPRRPAVDPGDQPRPVGGEEAAVVLAVLEDAGVIEEGGQAGYCRSVPAEYPGTNEKKRSVGDRMACSTGLQNS